MKAPFPGKHQYAPGRRNNRANHLHEDAWKDFVSYLQEAGSRITTARRIVFDEVIDRGDHFRADDLAADLARGQNRVSRGTVYRTIALMVKAGFLRAIRDGDTHFHYEYIYGHTHHEHMICESCGDFIEFEAPEIIRAITRRCREHDFQEHHHRLSIFGICKKCASGK
ncbi:transcriptional repressor [bacterium]|nr:transcriptional repressor [bacterium]